MKEAVEASAPSGGVSHDLVPPQVAQGVCDCGQVGPLCQWIEDLPGLVVMRCCGALYQRRGLFLSLVKAGGLDIPENRLAACDTGLRVLALDIDGVLNAGGAQIGSLIPDKLALLQEIIGRTDCRVVVISSWRHVMRQMDRLKEVFTAHGIAFALAPGVMGAEVAAGGMVLACGSKGDDLRLWLVEHPEVMSLVVLDDEPVDGFADCQVMPVSTEGLSPALVEVVCGKLMGVGGAATP